MEPPVLNIPNELTFILQAGLSRESVTVNVSEFSIEKLKELACNFLDKKFSDHGISKLEQRLLFFRHDYNFDSILLPVLTTSDVVENGIIEIVLSGNSASYDAQMRAHSLMLHSYKSPTFCDFCGEMLFGLVRQGLKCEGCGLSFHKRCVYKIPNNCTHTRRRRSSTFLHTPNQPDQVGVSLSIPNMGSDAVYGLVGIFLPWKLLLNGDIELLNHIISAFQNCSVRKPVLILEVLLNVRIHLGQKFFRRVDNLTTWHNDEAY
ncbi:hypothetical protein TNCT_663981 [Trichonephila clavata]|uniref:Phorbol-ester/DAG-type domain-containing protein n=1 Tax=Trichonephila clavata TaxID=2740835 RepID=A0A8X6J8U7_TRICU|nr:hypothetical protein TNCT_663981 [Trichonephila clavata]